MTKEEFTQHVRAFRKDIDTLINSTQLLPPSREQALLKTNLQRSKMWLGKVLQEIGTPNPYPTSEQPASPTIEPQAEHSDINYESRWNGMDMTAKVKDFRSLVGEVVDRMKGMVSGDGAIMTDQDEEGFGFVYMMISYITSLTALDEAKMWLGMELDRIRTAATTTAQ